MGNILIILTSAASLAGHPTGFHWEEFATPYYAFKEAGYDVTIASVKGGEPPADPTSMEDAKNKSIESVVRYWADEAAMQKLQNSLRADSLDFSEYDAIFFPGGHGTMADLPTANMLAEKLGKAYDGGAVIGAACHGPAIYTITTRADGKPLVAGKRVVAFTNVEEDAIDASKNMPFMLETRLREQGALFENSDLWQAHTVCDGNLCSGQNPASSTDLAAKMLARLAGK